MCFWVVKRFVCWLHHSLNNGIYAMQTFFFCEPFLFAASTFLGGRHGTICGSEVCIIDGKALGVGRPVLSLIVQQFDGWGPGSSLVSSMKYHLMSGEVLPVETQHYSIEAAFRSIRWYV